jgi:hypothetical protein
MSKNSTENKNGRYVLGGTTEVSLSFIEWWNRKEMKRHPSDIIYAMEKKYEGRPDLLGYVFYGDSSLWWIIAQFNGILDPMDEMVEGKILYIPQLDRIQKDLKSQGNTINGIQSLRT